MAMQKHLWISALALCLGAGKSLASGGVETVSKPASHTEAPAVKTPKAKVKAPKEKLGEAHITLDAMEIRLKRPATISLHNAKGELLFQLDSFRETETLPLRGVDSGFLYLTLRAGKVEFTQKLVYTGK